MKRILSNGMYVKEEKTENGVHLRCYFRNSKLFEEVICLEKDAESYIKSWEKL